MRRLLRRLGCHLARQGHRHEIWENPASGRMAAVPRHSGQEIPPGTPRKILSELDIEPSDLTN
ncbi:MAG: type II toxin-antitoxin system HicA family toxin [Actinobacteria bacterium]|nr:type II toxin-antitoxin system HicA family toxin [Actinomycetota bacterium]